MVRRPVRADPSARRRSMVTGGLLLIVFAVVCGGLISSAMSGKPLSTIDEHIHLDTALKVHDGEYPYRGVLLGDELIREWACGVGHEGGPIAKTCDDVSLSAEDVPSGKYSSGYIHYPTYFWAGEVFRAAADSVGNRKPIDTYRLFAAVVMSVGILACAAAGRSIGMRGSALLAVTFVPVAASGILLLGTIVNPGSTTILTGALIAGAGLRWVLRGGSFWWLALAGVAAAVTAVTNSLPLGAFGLAGIVALILRRRGWSVSDGWDPRWWQMGVLVAIAALPVLIWGRITEAHATVANDELYGFAGFEEWGGVLVGVLAELSYPHSPWVETWRLTAGGNVLVGLLRAPAVGIPTIVTIVIFGALLFASYRLLPSVTGAVGPAGVLGGKAAGSQAPGSQAAGSQPVSSAETESIGRPLDALWLLIVCTLLVIMLYPPALRFSNALTFGTDVAIVDRYTTPFTPLLTMLAVLAVPRPAFTRTLAVISSMAVVGIGVAAW